MEPRKYTLSLVAGFTILWLLLSNSLSWQVILVGAGISLALAILYAGTQYAMLGEFVVNRQMIKTFLCYCWVFLKELIKSNLDVARRVIDPSLPINPGIVEVKTRLKTPIGRLMLANSITLTPGTLTVETKDDSLFIHWIDISSSDIEAATQEIVSKFEAYLEVMYG